jgi:hypothetical protein
MESKVHYKNFQASMYCPVSNIIDIQDFDKFDEELKHLTNHVKLSKVYLECYRVGNFVSKEHLIRVKEYFESKGIQTAGGITTDDLWNHEGFSPFCYTSEKTKQTIIKAVTMLSEVFDEFILDDFYFTNCRCETCIKEKGSRTWSEFRLDLMKNFSQDVIIATAKKVNPKVNVIIKFPNWYEGFQDAGYNLEEEPKIFDAIYTGTETRNPTYAQQHLPKYLSYFIMQYFEHVAPNRNMGGWFDPYECSYNLTSYLEQAYLTLFGKAKEAMIFCLGSIIHDKNYVTFASALGQAFQDADEILEHLGNPMGIATYLPYHSYGEDNIHNYLGMCGLPMDPYPEYPSEAKLIFLAKQAAHDPKIVAKIKDSLNKGAQVVVTSGLVEQLGDDFLEFMHVSYTNQKALVNEYLYSEDGGVMINGKVEVAEKILIPQMRYFTNDVWELAGAYGKDNNFPIILRTRYAKGRIYVVTIPDNLGDLYQYPAKVWNVIRNCLCQELPYEIEGVAGVATFAYDNQTIIIRSDIPYYENISLVVHDNEVELFDLIHNSEVKGTTEQALMYDFKSGKKEEQMRFHIALTPGVNQVYQIRKK